MKTNILKTKYILSAILAIAMVFAVGCQKKTGITNSDSKSYAERDTSIIRIATNAENEPFEYKDDNGFFLGFDVALGMKLAEELDYTPVFENFNSDGLFSSLNCGTADMSISAIEISDEKKQQVDFTEEYITLSSAIVTTVNNTETSNVSTLKKAKKVGVAEGSIAEKYLTKTVGITNTQHYRNIETTKNALLSGECDVIFIDERLAEEMVQDNTELKITQKNINQKKYSIAVAKGNSELLKKINEKLTILKKDGTLLDLRNAYLGEDKELNKLFNSELKEAQNLN